MSIMQPEPESKLFRLGTSLRIHPPETTLTIAREFAHSLGVSRVTEITRLDRVGIPVFASIRPDSAFLCVNAGKGITRIEAEVSALMESLSMQ